MEDRVPPLKNKTFLKWAIVSVVAVAVLAAVVLLQSREEQPEDTKTGASDVVSSEDDTESVLVSDKQESSEVSETDSTAESSKEEAVSQDNSSETPSEPEVKEKRAEEVTRVYPFADRFVTPAGIKDEFFDSHTGMTIPYNLFLPDDYDPSKKYPVIFFLHGAGERGSDNSSHLIAVNNMYRDMGDIVRGAIVYCPQCPSEGWWNIHAYDYQNGDAEGALSAAIRGFGILKKQYSVDTERIYIMGFSMGGFGTWSALEWHGDMFAAGVPICGWGNAFAGNILKNIPIWVYHGTADTTVHISSSEEMYNAVLSAGGTDIEFTRLEGVGHNAWDYALSDRELFSWLFAQRKGSANVAGDYIPYFKIVSPSGETVITDKDISYIFSDFSFKENDNSRDFTLCLSDNGLLKLKNSYRQNKGRVFTVYFGSQRLYEFKATDEPYDEFFYIEGIFKTDNSESFYNILNKMR